MSVWLHTFSFTRDAVALVLDVVGTFPCSGLVSTNIQSSFMWLRNEIIVLFCLFIFIVEEVITMTICAVVVVTAVIGAVICYIRREKRSSSNYMPVPNDSPL